jgi:hypothetical protein
MMSRFGMVLALAVCAPGAFGQSSLELQRRSVKTMQESVASQRSTANKQSGAPAWTISSPQLEASAIAPVAPVAPIADCERLPEPAVASLVAAASTARQVDPDLLRAVIRKESAFRPCAVSPKGAMGLMQIMPDTAGYLKLSDPFDPARNVDAGARYLKELIGRFGGDLRLALAAYNAGPAKVDGGVVPDTPETQSYVQQILGELERKSFNPRSTSEINPSRYEAAAATRPQ